MTALSFDMDHRWGARTSVNLDVRLICHPGVIAPGRHTISAWLTDVSISGAFVRTELMMQLLSPVRIVVMDRLPSGRRSMELPAFVIRRDRSGLGLEWQGLSPKTWHRLYCVFAPLDVDAAPWPCRIRADLPRGMITE